MENERSDRILMRAGAIHGQYTRHSPAAAGQYPGPHLWAGGIQRFSLLPLAQPAAVSPRGHPAAGRGRPCWPCYGTPARWSAGGGGFAQPGAARDGGGKLCHLELLPSVLLHVSLGSRRSLLCWIGYGVGLLACGIHLAEIFGTEVASHQFGLRLITFGFGALAILAALASGRINSNARGGHAHAGRHGPLPVAVSFAHFGEAHGPMPGLTSSWCTCRHPAGAGRAAAGLPLSAAGRLHSLSGECAAGGGLRGGPDRAVEPVGARSRPPREGSPWR